MSIDPFGFLSKYQAFNFKIENVARSCSGIAKVMHKNRKLQKRFLDGLITSVGRSDSFEEAKERTSLLNEFDGYNRRQVNDVLHIAIDNLQIHRSFGARRQLEFFLKKYKPDEALTRAFRKLIANN